MLNYNYLLYCIRVIFLKLKLYIAIYILYYIKQYRANLRRLRLSSSGPSSSSSSSVRGLLSDDARTAAAFDDVGRI